MKTTLKKLGLLLMVTVFLLTGCNQMSTNPADQNGVVEKPKNITKKTNTKAKVEEVVPTLKANFDGSDIEFKLRSQIASYTTAKNGEIKIMLANTFKQSCTEADPKLEDNEERLVLTLKNKDAAKPIEVSTFKAGTDHTFTVVLERKDSKTPFEGAEVGTVEVTYINEAVIRGKLQLNDGKKKVEGEFFAAICKK